MELRECSFQLVCHRCDLTGGDGWDGLQVTLRKADAGTWGAAFLGEEALQTSCAADGALAAVATEELMSLGNLLQRMTAATADGTVLASDADYLVADCVHAMLAFSAHELLAAKALPQVALAMRGHPEAKALQAAGCALLATVPPLTNRAVSLELKESQLLRAATMAALQEGADLLTRARCIEALLGFARAAAVEAASGGTSGPDFVGIAECIEELLTEETCGIKLLILVIQTDPPPLCELACEALRLLAASGERRLVHALHRQGALSALFSHLRPEPFTSSPPPSSLRVLPPAAWQRACFRPLLALALSSELDVQLALLEDGFVASSLELLRTSSSAASLLAVRAIASLSWGASTSTLREATRSELLRLDAAARLIRTAQALSASVALRMAALRCLHEQSALYNEEAEGAAEAAANMKVIATTKTKWMMAIDKVEQVKVVQAKVVHAEATPAVAAVEAEAADELLEARFALEWLTSDGQAASGNAMAAEKEAKQSLSEASATTKDVSHVASEEAISDVAAPILERHRKAWRAATVIANGGGSTAAAWERQQQERAIAMLVGDGDADAAKRAVGATTMALQVIARMASCSERRRQRLLDAGACAVLVRALPMVGAQGVQARLLSTALAHLSPLRAAQQTLMELSYISSLIDVFEDCVLGLDSQSAVAQREVSTPISVSSPRHLHAISVSSPRQLCVISASYLHLHAILLGLYHHWPRRAC